jgi:hypothetical protein
MKYNSTLFNKIFNTSSNNNNNNNHINTNNSINNNKTNNKNIKVSPPATSNINMAAVINNTPISNSIVTTTRFTDEYDLKEELGKGAFSIVRRCIQKKFRTRICCKNY